MTPRKESANAKEGILEQMLRRLRASGTSVEQILDNVQFCYNSHTRRGYDDEWSVKDLYDNGEY